VKKTNFVPLIIAIISSGLFILWGIQKISMNEKFGDLPFLVAIIICCMYFAHKRIGVTAIISFLKSIFN